MEEFFCAEPVCQGGVVLHVYVAEDICYYFGHIKKRITGA